MSNLCLKMLYEMLSGVGRISVEEGHTQCTLADLEMD